VLLPGAIDALINTFAEHNNVGLVGAKLLNADGTVQEAGGILWRDGSAWNWGRGQDREDPRFNFVRDADYCSGAALAVRRELFNELGGFDLHYAPAYYEDTDFAFRVRAHGLRVLYQPAAEIFHLEGVSHGRDENSGVKAYQVGNARKFFERWQDTLKSHRENAVEPELEAHRASKSNVLIVEACMVTPDQDSGSVRMLNFMRLLKSEGHHVMFVADNLDGNPKYARILTALGIEVMHSKYAGSVRKLLRDRGPTLDAVVFCRHYIASQYVEHVRAWAPHARIVFDTVDLHFVREEREAKLHASESMARAAAVTRVKELRVIARSDVTIVVSEFEKQLLAQIAPAAGVEIVSNIHADSPTRAAYEKRDGILFVGGFRHPPNTDAVRWYATEVLPHVRRLLPDVSTKIVGSNITDEVRALAQPGLEIVGFVEDTAPLLQSSKVSIAPLRYGAGVKGKVNEAMNHGIPVVATSCAVEGMHLEFGREVLVSDDALGFAEAIARAYNDEALWTTLSAAGINNVHRHFSMEAALPAVRRVFASTSK
jgi:glycosyltransferase involved in cell wall biosynthesis